MASRVAPSGRAALPFAAATVLAEVAYPLVHGPVRDAVTVATVLAFFVASGSHAALTRGGRSAAVLLVVTVGGGLLAETVGLRTGWPFGRYRYTGGLGPSLAGVPVVIPLAWAMMAWPAYLAAARLTRSWRRTRPAWLARVSRVAVAGWALAGWDLSLDPQMVAAGHWRWLRPDPGLPGVPGVPLSNYLGWVAVSCVLMAVLDGVVGRQGCLDRGDDAVPIGLYLWTYGSSVLAHAAFFGLPGSAAWGAVGMGLVAIPLAGSLRQPERVPA
ncbi:MAG TPA: carotenoid biosynthesis protein [Mycobacteriales bacterium]|nr:carotenoid biosynthesis protein [Mycobacteriales bacterium]